MPPSPLPPLRLVNQGIARPFESPADAVRSLGAVQAQDYLGSLWALGLRVPGTTEADVEKAVTDRAIVRSWPMRGTLHWVAAEDLRWLLALLTPRVITGSAGRHRQLELDDAVFSKSREVLATALRDGPPLSRPEIYQVLERARISVADSRGLHILGRLAMEGLLCFGPRAGKQQTFTLLDRWLPPTPPRDRDDALGEVARRYFTSRGPATVADFKWWSGLTVADSKAAIAIAAPHLVKRTVDGVDHWSGPDPRRPPAASRRAHLLPAFDEYTVAYAERSAVLDARHARHVNAGGGILNPVIVIGGRVVGVWRRVLGPGTVTITPLPFARLSATDRKALADASRRYGRFLGLDPTVEPPVTTLLARRFPAR